MTTTSTTENTTSTTENTTTTTTTKKKANPFAAITKALATPSEKRKARNDEMAKREEERFQKRLAVVLTGEFKTTDKKGKEHEHTLNAGATLKKVFQLFAEPGERTPAQVVEALAPAKLDQRFRWFGIKEQVLALVASENAANRGPIPLNEVAHVLGLVATEDVVIPSSEPVETPVAQQEQAKPANAKSNGKGKHRPVGSAPRA